MNCIIFACAGSAFGVGVSRIWMNVMLVSRSGRMLIGMPNT